MSGSRRASLSRRPVRSSTPRAFVPSRELENALDVLTASPHAARWALRQLELDEPDRRGGVRRSGDGVGYDRIPEDESPHKLAEKTRWRRVAAQRERERGATGLGFSVTTLADGRRVVCDRGTCQFVGEDETVGSLARRVAAIEAAWRS